jgi:hypothetical protein
LWKDKLIKRLFFPYLMTWYDVELGKTEFGQLDKAFNTYMFRTENNGLWAQVIYKAANGDKAIASYDASRIVVYHGVIEQLPKLARKITKDRLTSVSRLEFLAEKEF